MYMYVVRSHNSKAIIDRRYRKFISQFTAIMQSAAQ